MKAISIKSPWANMIRNGDKTIEIRTWTTKYRGPLLLCCSKKPSSILSGKAFAICNLAGIRPMKKIDERQAKCPLYFGAFSWFLEDIKPIKPFEVIGRLGLFDVEVTDE